MSETRPLNKIVKEWGNSLVITFNKEDMTVISKDLNISKLEKGDLIEFKILKVTKK